MNKPSRAPIVLSIIALVFAPIGLLISIGMYTGSSVWNETPLLVGACAVALAEAGAAIATLTGRAFHGRRLFLVYGVLGLALTGGDLFYMLAMPSPEYARNASGLIDAGGDLIGGLFHLGYAIGSAVWTIVVIALTATTRQTTSRELGLLPA